MNNLELFQETMKLYNIDAYIIPTCDYHNSEYVGEYFKSRQFLSGFTGSAGTLLVTKERGYLWTDGRYFIQAAKQLEGKGIDLMKIDEDITIEDFLADYLKFKQIVAFDGKVMPTNMALKLKEKLPDAQFLTDLDLINQVWQDRPKMPFSLIYKLDTFFCGKSYLEKLEEIRNEMKNHGANCHIITSLEDQAWLYNLRSNDIIHTPVFLAYTIITENTVTLYVDPSKIDYSINKYLSENKIEVKPYFNIYDEIKEITDKTILMDLNKINYQLYLGLESKNTIINDVDPSLLLKSIKNKTEIENIKKAHIKDGVAMTKFMYYIKTATQNNIEMSELSVSDYLEELRREDKGLVDLSFNTICAFKDHAAMMHYSATPESNAVIKGNGFLLVDSGGHYLEGTTDVTRTYALGNISNEMKLHYTYVLKSHISLAKTVFLKGCTGQILDCIAREPIWELELDYQCGTGHGVGYLLSVHEGPNRFRYKAPSAVLVPGMVTTDEPGIYLKGKYGIRIENELLCIEKSKNEYGTFLAFEPITYCPIDTDAINYNLLSNQEIDWLNKYQQMVYEKVSPYLNEIEKKWLEDYLHIEVEEPTEEQEKSLEN